MANEAILRDFLENPIDFTVANGTTIEKGELLKMTDPRTAAKSATAGEAIAGIAAVEKVASDGSTRLSVYRKGIFDMTASGAVTVGQAVMSAADANYPNTVKVADGAAVSGACIVGHALETASDAEVFQVLVNVGAGGKFSV